jgi:sulfatase modifying factor 1
MKNILIIIAVGLLLACSSKIDYTKDSYIEDNITKNTLVTDSSVDSSLNKANCPDDMIEVDGNFCPIVEQVCLKYLDKPICNKYDPLDPTKCLPGQLREPARCAEYRYPSKCLSKTLRKAHFCIDKYEGGVKKGELPPYMKSWLDGKVECEAKGKRLCVDYEWTLACEGPSMKPYPYGYKRDSSACNIDKDQRKGFDHSKVFRFTPQMLAWLDQRVAAGSMPNCVSDYGVYDMTGNVDEATINESGVPYKNALKGGHWVKGARNRCRPRNNNSSRIIC